MTSIRNFLTDQQGTAAIQYALVAGVMSLAVLAGSLALRGSIIDLYDGMVTTASGALTGQPATGSLPAKEG